MENRLLKQKYLDEKVFYGLTNLNDGFDSESIKYFNEHDFEIVLERVEQLGLGIYGIEPWLNGDFYGVMTCDNFEKEPADADWYKAAFEKFKSKNLDLQFAASYYIPSLKKSL